jgi:hypothetical protein
MGKIAIAGGGMCGLAMSMMLADVFTRPGFVEHLGSLGHRASTDPIPGPNRADLEELLTA